MSSNMKKWFVGEFPIEYPDNIADLTITGAFLDQARRGVDRVIIADQISGVKTYRQMIIAQSVYHPNPAQGSTLGRLIDSYKATILISAPTFIRGILRSCKSVQLESLRMVITGAEKCQTHVYEALKKMCPQATVLEGYGVTECSPIISVNTQDDPRVGTIGRVLKSIRYAVVEIGCTKRVGAGEKGLLIVRGANVFGGYLNYDGLSPFVEFEDRLWYSTGDLVCEDEDGILTFCGRLKRFVKIGGETVSLPAIESALLDSYATEEDHSNILAIIAVESAGRPEIMMFTTKDVAVSDANARIKDSGLSGLHKIKNVYKLEALPLNGAGKIDYPKLAQLAGGARVTLPLIHKKFLEN